MRKKITSKIICASALVLAGFTGWVALAETQDDKATVGQGSGTGCIGTYYAIARMTNGAGIFWLTPPANTTNGVLRTRLDFHTHMLQHWW